MDWKNILEFHKEIVLRAQKEFYLLKEDDSRRFASINDFELSSFSGPWTAMLNQIDNEYYQRNKNTIFDQSEWVLGLCAVKYYQSWCPLFVKEITVKIDEDSNLVFNPAQANWDISPQLINLIEKDKNTKFDNDELNDNIKRLFERVFNKFNLDGNDKLFDILVEETKYEFPVLSEYFNGPSMDFVLFNAPQNAGKYDRNLMSDYKGLIERINKNPSDIGGLKLIESFETNYKYDTDIKVENIIPLNQSQENAVKGILESNPITVISGPPGCGKSQVVVSTLYNSWINNSSILFASQNNKAVEVVKERLEMMELPIPILVRAGSSQFSNIASIPKLMVNALANIKEINKNQNLDSIDEQIKNLKIKRGYLQEFIDSKVPVKLEETYKAALSSYSESIKYSDLLKSKYKAINNKIIELGVESDREKLKDDITILSKWIDSASIYKNQDLENIEKIKLISEEIENHKKAFYNSLNNFDINEKIVYEDIESNTFDELYDKYNNFKINWLSEHSKYFIFKHEKDCLINKYSKEEIFKLIDNVNEVNGKVQEYLDNYNDRIDNYFYFRNELEKQYDLLRKIKIDINIDISEDLIREWMNTYFEYSGEFEGFIVPFSKKYNAKKRLIQIEKEVMNKIPKTILIELGNINKNRIKLAEIFSIILDYYEFRNINQSYISIMEDIEKRISEIQIKMKLYGLSIQDSYFLSLDGLIQLIKDLAASHLKYKYALERYNLIERREIANRYLTTFINNVEVSMKTNILAKLIYSEILSTLKIYIDKLLNEETEDNLNLLNAQINDMRYELVFENWKQITVIIKNIKSLTNQLDNIDNYDKLLSEWKSNRPRFLKFDNILSGFDTDNIKENNILKELGKLQIDYEEFIKNEQKVYLAKIDEEYSFACSKINELFDNLPEEIINDDLKNVIDEINKNGKHYVWPTEKIEELIRNRNVSKIQANIESCDSKIQALVKEKGVVIWSKRIKNHGSILSEFEKLLTYFGKKSIDENNFRSLLKIMPIWITTAQSTKGIPLTPNIYDTLIIDEASQCTLTNLLPLIYRAKSIVVIGDSEQLPAIPNIRGNTESGLAEKYGLSDEQLYNYGHEKNDVFRTILKFLPGGYAKVYNLTEHYRSIPQIIVFSNRYIYNQRLNIRRNLTDDIFTTDSLAYGVHKFHIAGHSEKGKNNRSWMNRDEADKVVAIIDELIEKYNISKKRIGVVTPFTAQVDYIENMMSSFEKYSDILVGTAHKFQGDERDVIILSTVLSPNMVQSTIDWIQKPHNLINVAITRARNSLIVVGDFITMNKQVGILKDLYEYIEDIEKTKRTSPAEYKLLTYLGVQGIKPTVHARIKDIEVDFIVSKDGESLAIEVDGAQHNKQQVLDKSRDVMLQSMGYKVMRISARDVMETPNVVIEKIMGNFSKDNQL